MRSSLPCLRVAGAVIWLLALVSSASAQWAWRDENGRPVYSDVPPPPNVKSSDILRQPTLQSAPDTSENSDAGAASPGNAASPAAPGSAPVPHAPTVAEQEQEFRKRQKERVDAEKKQADEQAQAARDADNCQRARGYMRALDDGARLVRTDPDGNRIPLDEDQRSAEIQRTRQTIEQTCK